MTTPMAPPTGVAASQPQQQVMMQTSAGPVLVPSASVAQMMPGQGVVPNPQAMQQQMVGGQPLPIPGQNFAPNAALPTQQVVYGQGIAQPQTQPPLMSTSVAPVMYGQGVSQAAVSTAPPPPLPPSLPLTQPPVMATSIASNQPMMSYGQGVSQDPDAPPPLPQTEPPPIMPSSDAITSNPSENLPGEQEGSSSSSSAAGKASLSQGSTTGTGMTATPATMLRQKRRSEDVRALVLGPLEDQFDSLMDQVRDADPTAVLKKVKTTQQLFSSHSECQNVLIMHHSITH